MSLSTLQLSLLFLCLSCAILFIDWNLGQGPGTLVINCPGPDFPWIHRRKCCKWLHVNRANTISDLSSTPRQLSHAYPNILGILKLAYKWSQLARHTMSWAKIHITKSGWPDMAMDIREKIQACWCNLLVLNYTRPLRRGCEPHGLFDWQNDVLGILGHIFCQF